MSRKYTLTTCLAVLLTSLVWSQEVVFKTLASQGTCMVQRGNNPDNYTQIKTGVKLYEEDKIIITGDNSYVGLVSSTGKTLELKKGGVYHVHELKAGIVSGDASLAQKYVQFLMQNLSKADETTAQNMNYTGAVERSIRQDAIALFIPENTKVTSEKAAIRWYPKKPAASYEVVISNLFDEEVYKTTASSTSIELDIASMGLSSDEVYKLVVREAGDPSVTSGVVTLRLAESSETSTVRTEVKNLKAETPENSALQDMVVATYFDQHELYLHAIPYFEQAIAKEPEVEEYQTAYNAFLFKVGLERME